MPYGELNNYLVGFIRNVSSFFISNKNRIYWPNSHELNNDTLIFKTHGSLQKNFEPVK